MGDYSYVSDKLFFAHKLLNLVYLLKSPHS